MKADSNTRFHLVCYNQKRGLKCCFTFIWSGYICCFQNCIVTYGYHLFSGISIKNSETFILNIRTCDICTSVSTHAVKIVVVWCCLNIRRPDVVKRGNIWEAVRYEFLYQTDHWLAVYLGMLPSPRLFSLCAECLNHKLWEWNELIDIKCLHLIFDSKTYLLDIYIPLLC